jgi:sulfate adenylyltransferase subunit 1
MVTAASTADLAIILIDARKGVLAQTRRHSYIAHLLGIPHVVVAVNKMDLVDYSPEVFERIKADYLAFAGKLGIERAALHADVGAARRHDRRPRRAPDWYDGPTLFELLETVPAVHSAHAEKFRFPVQYVCRPQDSEQPGTARLSRLHGPCRVRRTGHRRRGDGAALGAGNARQGHPGARRVAAVAPSPSSR